MNIVGGQWKFILYAISLSGPKAEEVFSSQGDIGRPLWLSNGKLLVTIYSGSVRGGQLWTISYPKGLAERFTNDLTNYTSAIDSSSDRKELAAIVTTVSSNVWVASAGNLSHPVQITSGGAPPLKVRELDDGRLAMFVAGVESSKDSAKKLPDPRKAPEGTAVWTMTIDGGHLLPWHEMDSPEWIEPCGKSLLAVGNKDGNSIQLHNERDGSPPKALATRDVVLPVCSPAGKFVYYLNSAHPQKIRRIAVDDGSTTEIADVLGDTLFGVAPAVSPDGKLLAYPYQQFSPPHVAIAVIPATGGPPLHDLTLPGFSGMLGWSPDGRSLQYLLTNDGVTNLWEQSLNGGKARQMTHFTAGQIFDFSWTRDGKHILLVRGEANSDVVLIEDPR